MVPAAPRLEMLVVGSRSDPTLLDAVRSDRSMHQQPLPSTSQRLTGSRKRSILKPLLCCTARMSEDVRKLPWRHKCHPCLALAVPFQLNNIRGKRPRTSPTWGKNYCTVTAHSGSPGEGRQGPKAHSELRISTLQLLPPPRPLGTKRNVNFRISSGGAFRQAEAVLQPEKPVLSKLSATGSKIKRKKWLAP